MFTNSVSRCTRFSMGWLLSVCFVCNISYAQVSEKPIVGMGEVTTNDLYVRSGDSLNHYTITKLKAGDRVTIVGQRGKWFEILPPINTFSLISADFVDTADDRTGVVNGNNVRIRAGSLLNDSKYTVQTHLSKNAEVTIMGRNADGFLRIKPPTGATLWVNREYIQMVPENRIALNQSDPSSIPVDSMESPLNVTTRRSDELHIIQPASADDADAIDLTAIPADPASTKTEKKQPAINIETSISVFEGLPPTDQRTELVKIDSYARAEMAKPIFQRQWAGLTRRYQSIVNQDEDLLAAQYAQKRIDQISEMSTLAVTVRKMRKLNEIAESKRRESLAGRSIIQDVVISQPSSLDAQGVLRVSALYPPGTIPRRFRLMNISSAGSRTIGYVEIPDDSTLTVDSYLGKLVGVRASSISLQQGGVESVPIYVAKELVLLENDESDD